MIQGFITQSNPLTILARVVDQTGNPITQASVSAITITVFNAETAAQTWSASPTVGSTICNTLQTDARWTTDSIGYNVAAVVDGSAINTGGSTFQVQVKITPVSGDVFTVVARAKSRTIFG